MSRLQDVIVRDTRALQPAATAVAIGCLYYVTDEQVLERSNGTVWEDMSSLGAPGSTGPAGPPGAAGATGPAGPSVWGGISGSLSAQADLVAEFALKPDLAGSYADPAWITSLAASKLTGTALPAAIIGSSLTGLGVLTALVVGAASAAIKVGADLSLQAVPSDLGGLSEVATDAQVYVANTVDSGAIFIDQVGTPTGAGMVLRQAGGTAAAPTDSTVGHQIGYLDFRPYSGTKFWQCAGLAAHVDGAFTSGQAPPSRIQFATNVANGGSTERMRIDQKGRMLIGTTAVLSGLTDEALLQVKGVLAGQYTVGILAAPASGAALAVRIHTTPATTSDYPLIISTGAGGGTALVCVNGLGNLALGKLAATVRLDVVGSALISGTLGVTGAITGSVTGNASTATLAAGATVLATARLINGVSFNGSADITVTAAAGTLTGTALPATVLASSLTSLGTIATLNAGTITATGNIQVGTAAVLWWGSSKVQLSSPANGHLTLTESGQTIGSRLNVGSLPSVASGFGTGPAVTAGSTPLAGSVNVGTGGVATSGVINFNGTAFPAAPFVVCMNQTTGAVVRAVASVTQLTITAPVAFVAGDIIAWHCISSK